MGACLRDPAAQSTTTEGMDPIRPELETRLEEDTADNRFEGMSVETSVERGVPGLEVLSRRRESNDAQEEMQLPPVLLDPSWGAGLVSVSLGTAGRDLGGVSLEATRSFGRTGELTTSCVRISGKRPDRSGPLAVLSGADSDVTDAALPVAVESKCACSAVRIRTSSSVGIAVTKVPFWLTLERAVERASDGGTKPVWSTIFLVALTAGACGSEFDLRTFEPVRGDKPVL